MLEQLRQQWGLTPLQMVAVMTALGGLIGFLFGLIPFLVGVAKKQKKLGVWGLLASTISGALLPSLVSIIVVAVFLVLILKKSAPAQQGADVSAPTDESQNQ